MKKLVFYFDHNVKRIFTEKEDENGEKKTVVSSPYNFVSTSEIVARVIEIDNDEQIPTRLDPGYEYYNILNYIQFKIESGIYFDEANKAYKASDFGFVVFDNGKLKLLPLLSVSKDKTKAYYTVHPTKFNKIPTRSDIEEPMHFYKIAAGVGEKVLKEQLDKIDPNEKKFTRIIAAKGKEPVNGNEEYYIPLIDTEKKVGQILSDGRIDFKEVGSIIQVMKGQEILQRYKEVKPVGGYDVYGNKLEATMLPNEGFLKGGNIVQSGNDENIFLAGIDGCLDVNKKTISILPVVVINGNVDYDSGNIDFNGSVHIKGSVLSGFSVKATGSVTIDNNVEDATVQSNEDIIIKNGVLGKGESRVIAGGSITARYITSAKIEAVKSILVDESILHSDVFSNDRIVMSKAGKIIGGKITALYEIVANVSGSQNGTETQLFVGRNLFIEKELDDIRKDIADKREALGETMRKLKVNFGEGVFENPKEFIGILPPLKKKLCLTLLKELGEGNKELKALVEKGKEVQDKLKLDKEPVIIIKDKAFIGTIVNVRKSVKKLESTLDNVRFFEDPEQKIIRYTSAV